MKYGPSNGWLDGQPAVITRKVGKGSITYVGAWLDDALLAKLTASAIQQSGVQPIIPNAPEGVEVCERSKGDHSVADNYQSQQDSAAVALAACGDRSAGRWKSVGFFSRFAEVRSGGAGVGESRLG